MLENYSIINFDSPLKSVPAKSCNGCTACCEGYLSCNIFGYEVRNGRHCRFVDQGKGCQAYDLRPYNPCKTFLCYWKQDETVPEKFKPNVCGNIMVYRKSAEGIMHLDIVEATKPLNLELLDWALTRFRKKKIDSLRWFLNGKINYVSRDEKFIEHMEKLLAEYDKAGLV